MQGALQRNTLSGCELCEEFFVAEKKPLASAAIRHSDGAVSGHANVVTVQYRIVFVECGHLIMHQM